MLNRLKNLKVVKSLGKHISPKLRWLNFMNHNIDKSSPEYIRMISGVDELKSSSDERKLEAMVREQLKEEFPNISLGTVYRNLNLLADIGEAIKITTPDGGDRFDARTNPHYHFYCKCCKRMIDMDFDHMDKINQLASESFDGQIESHTMLFYGICGDCLRKS